MRYLFFFKLLLGCLVAIYFDNFFLSPDHYMYNEAGKEELALLKHDPSLFFAQLFAAAEYDKIGLWDATGSFWADLRFMVVFKFVGIMSILTNGNFYLNTLIFSSIIFWGHIAFYRAFIQLYPGRKWEILAACFLIPSQMVYTACVHKDGIIFFCLGILSMLVLKMLSRKRLPVKLIVAGVLAVLLIMLIRNYMLLALFPALVLGAVYMRTQKLNPWLVTGGVAVLLLILFFATGWLDDSLDLPARIVQRKNDIAILPAGKTNLAMPKLEPNGLSFLLNLPTALNHGLFRPYLWESSSVSVFAVALELFVLQLVVVLRILFPARKTGSVHPFNVFGWSFFLLMIMIIGYCVPNAGSIVRYRGILWLFIMCPLVCTTNWYSISKFFRRWVKPA